LFAAATNSRLDGSMTILIGMRSWPAIAKVADVTDGVSRTIEHLNPSLDGSVTYTRPRPLAPRLAAC
jgi:hypothetical protein